MSSLKSISHNLPRAMHCQTDEPIPLKDTNSEKAQHSFMDVPELAKKKAQQSKSPNESEKKVHPPILPHENDILLGRGGKNNMHVGNEKLRELARTVAEQYHRSSKKEKSYLSRTLVQKVKEMDPPGRFLRRHPKDNLWEDMSDDEDKCREKCAQVLRDAVAYVGLKDAPPPSMAQREQHLQHNPYAMRQNQLAMQAHMQQQSMRMNPFAMSASTSSQILSHHQQLMAASSAGDISSAASRQFAFPNFNRPPPQLPRHSLTPSTGSYEPIGLSSATGYASMPPAGIPQSINIHPGMPALQGDGRPFNIYPGMPSLPQGDGRPAKRARRLSNPYFDPFASTVTMTGETGYGNDRRLSIASNSYPAGSDFPSQNIPGPRVRRDSLFGNLSVGAHGSDHSVRDFELFPDITDNNDCAAPKNDTDAAAGDEFSSDFC
ncbi:expressed unknown protein [Seminavis robusta]|uniref:DUF6824 domain-containing protein n=1 Tax=Seminavis robusta TaxID=568900 RepID=A0A9N8EYF3_9STRA|nr:expressed unknown protein [Seminavis robusta]|eukprot:Sro2180_g317970.1 n/a (433) ;mRNA; f:11519-13192